MGKTARWFRGLLGKKDTSSSSKVSSGGGGGSDVKPKKRWSFVKSSKDKEHHNQNHSTYSTSSQVTERIVYNERRGFYREVDGGGGDIRSTSSSVYLEDVDSNKHAIAVAAATAAVAEAAVAAAQAAAAVVKLTSSGRCTTAYVSGNGATREDWAAVRIQAAFRGYLARRALHALKALVKLQALVRGHIVRKKTAETMRCMQALVRVQSRARAGRAHISETLQPNKKLSKSHNSGPATPEKYERAIRSNSTRHDRDSTLKRNWSKPNHSGRNCLDHRMDEQWDYHRETPSKTTSTYDDKSDKILEIDPGKPYFNTKRWNAQVSQHALASDRISRSFTTFDSPSKDSTTAHLSSSSQSSGEVQSVNPRIPQLEIEDEAFSTAQNSPQFYSASSRGGSIKRGPFTPTTSDCSRSYFSGYSDYPNYMANTESSKAKVRSQSAPKQRLEFEKSSSTKRYSVQGFGDSRSNAQRASAAVHANFASKAYPGSGRLDRLGMPIRSETVGYNGMYRTKY